MTYPILCSGPGPHDPTNGILGFADIETSHDMRCSSLSCVAVPTQQPLDPTGVLATLLVVEGVLNINDAANAVNVTPADLIAEAQAWAIASSAIQ